MMMNNIRELRIRQVVEHLLDVLRFFHSLPRRGTWCCSCWDSHSLLLVLLCLLLSRLAVRSPERWGIWNLTSYI